MIVVTGATGLVGGNLIWYLLQENDRVVATCRPFSNRDSLRTIFSFYTSEPDEYLARIDWKMADVLDASSINDVLKGATTVYHCAAIVSFNTVSDDLLSTNVVGTRNIVQGALDNGVEKLCFVSSIAACDNGGNDEFIDESSLWSDSEDKSLYSKSKYYSEQEVWKGIQQGLNAVIVNPGVILGVSGNRSGISQLFEQVQKGLLFYTNGGSGYVDVQDIVKAMIRLTMSDISGERFILVGENCSNREIMNWMADGFGKHRPVILVGNSVLWLVGALSEFIGKVFHFSPLIDRGTARVASSRKYYSNEKIIKAIGFHFKPIEKSIREVCEYIISIDK